MIGINLCSCYFKADVYMLLFCGINVICVTKVVTLSPIIVKILSLYIILLCTYLHHFFLVSVHLNNNKRKFRIPGKKSRFLIQQITANGLRHARCSIPPSNCYIYPLPAVHSFYIPRCSYHLLYND